MSRHEIERHITNLPNVSVADHFGYRFFFYGTGRTLPIVMIAEADNEYDHVSNLHRGGVLRVNIGVGNDSYKTLLAEETKEWDHAALNQFMPHPQYAAQHFICVPNPSGDIFLQALRYIEEAHAIAKGWFERKQI